MVALFVLVSQSELSKQNIENNGLSLVILIITGINESVQKSATLTFIFTIKIVEIKAI